MKHTRMPAILTIEDANKSYRLLVPTKHTPARTNPPLGSAYQSFGPTWRSPDHSSLSFSSARGRLARARGGGALSFYSIVLLNIFCFGEGRLKFRFN